QRRRRLVRPRDRRARQEHPPQDRARSARAGLSPDRIRRRLQGGRAMRCAPPWWRPPRRTSPPRWWPHGEAWPPTDPAARLRHRRRARFMRRAGLAFGLVFLLSLVGASTLVSSLTRGVASVSVSQVLVVLLVAVWIAVFLFFTRAVGSPIGDIVGAAGRVAEGDFKVRVAPKGTTTLR